MKYYFNDQVVMWNINNNSLEERASVERDYGTPVEFPFSESQSMEVRHSFV